MIGKKHIYLQCQYKFSINSILITVKKTIKSIKLGGKIVLLFPSCGTSSLKQWC